MNLLDLHMEIYVLKQSLADINEYTAGKLKKLSVDNQISQNFLLQLIQRNKEKNVSKQDSLYNEYTDIFQPFSMGFGTKMSIYKSLMNPTKTSWCGHGFCKKEKKIL